MLHGGHPICRNDSCIAHRDNDVNASSAVTLGTAPLYPSTAARPRTKERGYSYAAETY